MQQCASKKTLRRDYTDLSVFCDTGRPSGKLHLNTCTFIITRAIQDTYCGTFRHIYTNILKSQYFFMYFFKIYDIIVSYQVLL